MPRTKKTTATAASAVKTAAKAVTKKTTTRKTAARKRVKPNFVIQNSADQSVTYDDILKKVKAAYTDEIKSVDIYVKAEEGKAYYVINGDVTGDVNLF